MLKRLLISLLFLIPLIGYSQTYTYETMQDYINTNITTNGANLITGAKLNTALNYITKETGGLKEYDTTATYIQYQNAVLYDSTIYVCNTTIGVAENWNATKWTATGIVNKINGDTIIYNFNTDTTFFTFSPVRMDTATEFEFVIVSDSDTAKKGMIADIDTFSFPRFNADTLDVDSVIISNGAVMYGITTIGTPTYTVLDTDHNIHVKYTLTGTVAITLPTALMTRGRHLFFKDAEGNALTNNITISTGGAETIDGEPSIIIDGDYDSACIYTDGSLWFVKYVLSYK